MVFASKCNTVYTVNYLKRPNNLSIYIKNGKSCLDAMSGIFEIGTV